MTFTCRWKCHFALQSDFFRAVTSHADVDFRRTIRFSGLYWEVYLWECHFGGEIDLPCFSCARVLSCSTFPSQGCAGTSPVLTASSLSSSKQSTCCEAGLKCLLGVLIDPLNMSEGTSTIPCCKWMFCVAGWPAKTSFTIPINRLSSCKYYNSMTQQFMAVSCKVVPYHFFIKKIMN